MRKIGRDVAFISFFSILLIVGLEFAVYKTPTELSYKGWYMTENANKIKYLLLGNSLFSNSFNSHILGDSAFNGATSGRTQFYDVGILKKYAYKMNNLEAVVFPIHICLWIAPESPFSTYPYALHLGVTNGRNPLQYSALYTGRLAFKSLIPTPVYSEIKEEDRIKNGIAIDSLGYCPVFHKYDGHRVNIPVRSFEAVMKDTSMFVDQIREMAGVCDSLGVKFICIIPPAEDVFVDRLDQRIFPAVDSIMTSLAQKQNIEYKSYFSSPDFREPSIYADEFHLNHIGATLFARRVKEDFNL